MSISRAGQYEHTVHALAYDDSLLADARSIPARGDLLRELSVEKQRLIWKQGSQRAGILTRSSVE